MNNTISDIKTAVTTEQVLPEEIHLVSNDEIGLIITSEQAATSETIKKLLSELPKDYIGLIHINLQHSLLSRIFPAINYEIDLTIISMEELVEILKGLNYLDIKNKYPACCKELANRITKNPIFSSWKETFWNKKYHCTYPVYATEEEKAQIFPTITLLLTLPPDIIRDMVCQEMDFSVSIPFLFLDSRIGSVFLSNAAFIRKQFNQYVTSENLDHLPVEFLSEKYVKMIPYTYNVYHTFDAMNTSIPDQSLEPFPENTLVDSADPEFHKCRHALREAYVSFALQKRAKIVKLAVVFATGHNYDLLIDKILALNCNMDGDFIELSGICPNLRIFKKYMEKGHHGYNLGIRTALEYKFLNRMFFANENLSKEKFRASTKEINEENQSKNTQKETKEETEKGEEEKEKGLMAEKKRQEYKQKEIYEFLTTHSDEYFTDQYIMVLPSPHADVSTLETRIEYAPPHNKLDFLSQVCRHAAQTHNNVLCLDLLTYLEKEKHPISDLIVSILNISCVYANTEVYGIVLRKVLPESVISSGRVMENLALLFFHDHLKYANAQIPRSYMEIRNSGCFAEKMALFSKEERAEYLSTKLTDLPTYREIIRTSKTTRMFRCIFELYLELFASFNYYFTFPENLMQSLISSGEVMVETCVQCCLEGKIKINTGKLHLIRHIPSISLELLDVVLLLKPKIYPDMFNVCLECDRKDIFLTLLHYKQQEDSLSDIQVADFFKSFYTRHQEYIEKHKNNKSYYEEVAQSREMLKKIITWRDFHIPPKYHFSLETP